MAILTGPRKDAISGNSKGLVIILHGYGADGNDLIGVAEPLSEYLPDVTFLAPNAPDRCTNNPMGYQWFPIPWLDGSSEEAALDGIKNASQILNQYIDEVIDLEGISSDKIVLLGFSQGTMMSLEVGPRRAEQVAGIVGFSGRLVRQEEFASEIVSRPPVLLVHGDMDDVVPPSSMPEAAEVLEKNGFKVFTHVSNGMAHGIAPDGLGLALQFIRQVLAMDTEETSEVETEDDEEDGFEGDDVSINFASDNTAD